MRLDVNSFLGSYPFRRVPGTSPDALLRAMDRVSVDQAWVTHLPGIFWRDPAAGNPWLYETAERYDRFRPDSGGASRPRRMGGRTRARPATREPRRFVAIRPTTVSTPPVPRCSRWLGPARLRACR